MAKPGAVVSVLVLLAMLAIPPANEARAGNPQPSLTKKILFIHYDDASNFMWMNADQHDTKTKYIHTSSGGFISFRSFSFPLVPKMNGSDCLMLNTSQVWVVRIHMTVDPGGATPRNVSASITLGNLTVSSCYSEYEDECYIYRMNVSTGFIAAGSNISLGLSFSGYGCVDLTSVKIYTDGSSNLTIPFWSTDIDTDQDGFPDSQDPDDDNDGRNDTVDAYPLDVTRWMKPGTAHPTPLWLYASSLPAILAIIVGAFLLRRRRRLRSAEPPLK